VAQAGAYWLFDLGRRLAVPNDDARLGGGALMLSTAHGLIVALRLALLWLAFRRLTGSPAWATAGAALVVALSAFNHLWILRPQILGELFFAAVLLALSRPVLSRRALVLVPLVFAVWANCHGSFAMGFALLGAAVVGRALEAAGGAPARGLAAGARLLAVWRDAQTRRLILVTALSVAATTLNPHGPALLWYSYKLSGDRNIADMEEWKALPIQSLSGYIFLASTALLLPLLRWSPKRFTATQVLLLLGFGLQSLAHARVLVWYIMVFAWVAVPHLQALAGRLFRPRPEAEPPNLRWTVIAGLGVVALALWSAPAVWLLWGDAPSGAHRVWAETPVKASRLLKEQYAADADGRLRPVVFTSETMGDYLLWDLRAKNGRGEGVRVFCYTHVHLLTRAHWEECLAVKSANSACPGRRSWQEVLDDAGVQFLVVERENYIAGKGISDLVDQVEADPARWVVLSKKDDKVFVARRTDVR
jgi:hypothetical protein